MSRSKFAIGNMVRRYSRPYVCFLHGEKKAVVKRFILGDGNLLSGDYEWVVGPFKTSSAARYCATRLNKGIDTRDTVKVSWSEKFVKVDWVRQSNGEYWPADIDEQRKANECDE